MISSWQSELIALGIALVAALALGGPMIRFLKRCGCKQRVRDDGPQRHLAKEGTPTMGGIIILIAVVVSLLASMWFRLLPPPDVSHLLLVLLALGFAALGFLDDYRMIKFGRSLGLRARYKLALQFALAALFLWAVHHYARLACPPGLGGPLERIFATPRQYQHWISLGWIYWPLAAILLVGTSNAINLTDGLDGLVAGLSVIALAALGILAHWRGCPGTTLFCFGLAGACLGFLWFNRHPARVFMGDTGSLALGGALAGAAIIIGAELWFLAIGLIFFVEMLSVVIQVISFQTTRRRVFKMTPLHHHFELSGWQENQIVYRWWLAGAIIAGLILFVIWWRSLVGI